VQSDKWDLGNDIFISNNARLNVSEYFKLGDRSIINDDVLIEGRCIEIGKEAWIDEHSHIGGGSCFDYMSYLKIGDFVHMGKFSHINTARKVSIGDECGIGIGTKIFTHGAYLSAWEGFPVQFDSVDIGDRVWLPHAWVNPKVTIGHDVVITPMSLVNRDIPSGCLAGGIPASVIKNNVYPKKLNAEEQKDLIQRISSDVRIDLFYMKGIIQVSDPNGKDKTNFNLDTRTIHGKCNEVTEKVKNQLRRYGIRFKYYGENGEYRPW